MQIANKAPIPAHKAPEIKAGRPMRTPPRAPAMAPARVNLPKNSAKVIVILLSYGEGV